MPVYSYDKNVTLTTHWGYYKNYKVAEILFSSHPQILSSPLCLALVSEQSRSRPEKEKKRNGNQAEGVLGTLNPFISTSPSFPKVPYPFLFRSPSSAKFTNANCACPAHRCSEIEDSAVTTTPLCVRSSRNGAIHTQNFTAKREVLGIKETSLS